MANLKVYNIKKEEVGSVELNDAVFNADYNEALIHQVIVAQHNNARQGTKSTLTRSEVNLTKKKMRFLIAFSFIFFVLKKMNI